MSSDTNKKGRFSVKEIIASHAVKLRSNYFQIEAYLTNILVNKLQEVDFFDITSFHNDQTSKNLKKIIHPYNTE